MGVFVTGSGVTPLSTLTFGEMKRKVAGVVSREATDPNDIGAGDAIEDVLREFNAHKWDYLAVLGSDIAIVDSTGLTAGVEGYRGQYTVPAPIRDFISAKIDFATGSAFGGTSLQWIHRANFDRIVEKASGFGPRFITGFQMGLTNKIEILDFPTQTGRLEIRYYRPIILPILDDERMDLPLNGPLESALLYKARAIVATDKGVRQKARFYEAKGEQALAKALGVDRLKQMQDTAWRPRHDLESQWPAEKKRHDFYGTWRRGR